MRTLLPALFVFAVLFLITASGTSTLAQTQPEYTVVAIKGPYLIIGQKPYKKLTECKNIKVADKVTFTEDPITCLQTEVVDLLTLTKCPVECLSNEQLPPEYQ